MYRKHLLDQEKDSGNNIFYFKLRERTRHNSGLLSVRINFFDLKSALTVFDIYALFNSLTIHARRACTQDLRMKSRKRNMCISPHPSNFTLLDRFSGIFACDSLFSHEFVKFWTEKKCGIIEM